MDVNEIITDPELVSLLATLKQQCGNKSFSDIVDDAGHQYIDLVMEGGGMLGIALVGYTYVLEQVGIRFLGLGGASAGSINALLIAALDEPANPKSPKLLEEMASKNFFDFVDGDNDARDFVESFVQGAGKFKLGFKAMQILDNLNEELGLNPGDSFTQWLVDVLEREGIRTLRDLNNRMGKVPAGLRIRAVDGEDEIPLDTVDKSGIKLAVVAADVSTETKVVFPGMAELYWSNPDSINPALFVRASMSIPYFFYPFRVKNLPSGEAARKRWENVGFYPKDEGGVPESAMFVDGGIMSNFPIDIFHELEGIPHAPTFGVKLEYDKRRKDIKGPLGLFGAIFNSARHCLDYDFIRRNPDYRRLVRWIPAKQYNWLDFNMSDDKIKGLFKEGAKEAAAFLLGFNWEGYKAIRKGIKEANKAQA
jgi:NTE family protein